MPLVRPHPQPATTASPTSSISKTQVPPFASCKFPEFTDEKSQWYQITSPHHYTNFDICADCYNTSLQPTNYARFISPAPPKPEGMSTRCDFSDLWVRIAWAWLFTHNYLDLTLLGTIAEIEDPEGSCPNLDRQNEDVQRGGKSSATRTWYSLQDTLTGNPIEDLTVCSHCIRHINTITPNLQGIFLPAASGQRLLGTCDLMVPSHDRTLAYLDQILEVAEKTLTSGYRDIQPLTAYIKLWAPVPPCPKDKKIPGQKCYNIPSRVPEFTICEECHITHIRPLLTRTPSHLFLTQLSSMPSVPLVGFTCQLYSPRLQQYFSDALSTNDLATLRQKLQQRDAKFRELKQKIELLRMQYEQQKMQAKFHMEMMVINQQSAMSQSLASQIASMGHSTYYSPSVIPDFRASDAQMNQAGQAEMQANMTMTNMQMVEKEWADFWE
ncbi:uncharacterized protein BDR25DRAFT_300874 [Lindgomyces ingoldianus]|uniref:Uncharacterized protein n=1 Tax=Lindgomyces ingoldianus TaxID=673940 RepID=A0ACB6RC78_9PLEO|nr:uncharacterized protein BDR25DRAFT_300874 [Lindgomyces ingoldianus]KAF2476076.1 hypothetical protein BDR25DRAFT_300874 [Lindgomyces ingoldianus]